MIGKNPLWVAKQHGHSVQTMLEVYAAWTEGATEEDVEAIKRAMQSSPRTRARSADTTASSPLASPDLATRVPPAKGHGAT